MGNLPCCTLHWVSCSQGGVLLAILITVDILLRSLGVTELRVSVKDE